MSHQGDRDRQHPTDEVTEQLGGFFAHLTEKANGGLQAAGAAVNDLTEKTTDKILSKAAEIAGDPTKVADLGAGMVGSATGETIGETVGGIVGSALGPAGTILGAGTGAAIGTVLGHRSAESVSHHVLHSGEKTAAEEKSLLEEVERGGVERIGANAGKETGEAIGEALLGDPGSEIGRSVGEKVGKLFAGKGFGDLLHRGHHESTHQEDSRGES
jgi:hypothetical protein